MTSEGKAAVAIDGKWGYIDTSGRLVIQTRFDQAWPFAENHAPVRLGKLWGLIDSSGTLRVPAQWDSLQPPSAGRAVVGQNGLFGLIDLSGQLILTPTYRSIEAFAEERAMVENKSLQRGYIDRQGKLISSWFIHAQPFSGGRAAVADSKNGGFIGTDGAWLVKNSIWTYVKDSPGPLMRVVLRDIDQLINSAGQVLWYGTVESLSEKSLGEGLLAWNAHKSGYIDLEGHAGLGPFEWFVGPFAENLAPYRDSTRQWGYLNRQGAVTIIPSFDEAAPFSDGLAAVKVAKQWGYINRNGSVVIAPRYDFASSFLGGVAVVRNAAGMGLINKQGREILVPGPRTITPRTSLSGEAAWFVVREEGRKVGFMDANGSWKIKPAFDGARNFSEERAAILQGKTWSYIDPKGTIIISEGYEEAWPYSNGLARVKAKGVYAYIDPKGKTVIPFSFRDGKDVQGGKVWLAEGRAEFPPRWGLADLSGNWLIQPIFDQVVQSWGNGAIVRIRQGTDAWVHRDGRIIRQW